MQATGAPEKCTSFVSKNSWKIKKCYYFQNVPILIYSLLKLFQTKIASFVLTVNYLSHISLNNTISQYNHI